MHWPFIILCYALYSGLIELIQPHVNRYGEWMDWIANIFGLIIGIFLSFLIKKLQRNQTIQ